MRTDVVLTSSAARATIETKYYATPFQTRFGGSKLISGHLYQLLTYLTHLRATEGPEPTGVLLYASGGEVQRLRYRLGGHTIPVRGLDLNRDRQAVHRDLIALAEELGAGLA